jgi:glucose/arabinose dehydrogenase
VTSSSSEPDRTALQLVPHAIRLSSGARFELQAPSELTITPAAEGIGRARFMARSPDGRIFVTDMVNLSDNANGSVFVLDDFDPATSTFRTKHTFLSGLRNPNSVAFHTDSAGLHWLYLALTDRLVRYQYRNGDVVPSHAAQTLLTFPDYGLNYKYGGWHLTRTVAIHDDKIYVSVGSSCNACVERTDEVRAAIIEANLDGSGARTFASGLRNAVGIRWRGSELFATNMGADHLGDNAPSEMFYRVEEGRNYGWPYCYQSDASVVADPKFSAGASAINCAAVPSATTTFPAHSAPLGLDWFPPDTASTPSLRGVFLAALHGSSSVSLGHGYQIVRFVEGQRPEPFITGFLQNGKVVGRPVDVLRLDASSFLFTDDKAGVVYHVQGRPSR